MAIVSRAVMPPQHAGAAPDQPATAMHSIGTLHPRISPDGRAVVFSYQAAIWRLPIDGGVMKRLAAVPGFAFEPCWSPDGSRIAFIQSRSLSGGQVQLIDAASGAAAALPQKVFASGKLFFSPDGQRLVGNLRGEKQPEALRSFDLKTGEIKTIARMRSSRQPWALSHDGRSLAYIATRDMPEQQSGNDGPQADVWKVNVLAGGEPERIVFFPARIHDVCWSPDGNALFVSSELGGAHNDLWRIDLKDPERPVKLTFGQADEEQPSVSADGRRLLYTDNQAGCPGLMLRNLATGATRPIPITGMDFGRQSGRLRLRVRDKGTGQPIVARVALEHAEGGAHAPPGALWRIYGDTGHSFIRDSVEFEVPAGAYRLRAWHGPEYRRQNLAFTVQPGETSEQTITLERWADANADGWYSGDNHIHANYGYGEYYTAPADLADFCESEGLNVCNFMVANSDGDGVFDREYFQGRPDPRSTEKTVLYWNEEFRSTLWGHMTLVNLKQVVEPVFTGFKDTTNPYDSPSMSDIAARTHRQGGLVNYTHPASLPNDLYRGAYSAKGLPVYAALGQIDTMDVMGSGERASGAFYYRLLNCGLRLAASAGTDCFLNRMRSKLPGDERVYVKVDGEFSYVKWILNLRAGKSFVTNGPLLDLSVAGKGLGATLELSSAQEVTVQGTARSQHPLDRVEVLYNGQVVATALAVKGELTTRLDQRIRLDRSGWVALRASGPPAADIRNDRVYAQSSPIYVTIAGKPAGSAEDAQYFLSWIDRLEQQMRDRDRIPDARSRAEVQAELTLARQFYQRIVDRENQK